MRSSTPVSGLCSAFAFMPALSALGTRPSSSSSSTRSSFSAPSFTVARRARARARTLMTSSPPEEVDPGVVTGTSLRVLRYPHPLLRADNVSIPVDELRTDAQLRDDVKTLAREMLRVMYASNGVGLAAPQVGVNRRVLVFNASGDKAAFLQEVVLLNPVVVAAARKTDIEQEACLSFPGMSGAVERAEWVKVEAYRINGSKVKAKYEGWKARVFQHELDHLNKVLYLDHLGEEDREAAKDALQRLVDEYEKYPHHGMAAAL